MLPSAMVACACPRMPLAKREREGGRGCTLQLEALSLCARNTRLHPHALRACACPQLCSSSCSRCLSRSAPGPCPSIKRPEGHGPLQGARRRPRGRRYRSHVLGLEQNELQSTHAGPSARESGRPFGPYMHDPRRRTPVHPVTIFVPNCICITMHRYAPKPIDVLSSPLHCKSTPATRARVRMHVFQRQHVQTTLRCTLSVASVL